VQLSVIADVDQATITVRLSGEIDCATAQQLQDVLCDQVRRSPESLVVDLADVTFLDCAGVGALLSVVRAARRAGVEMTARRPQPIVRRVLDLTRAGDQLPIADTADRTS
jgi:anti-anti-sigma factor